MGIYKEWGFIETPFETKPLTPDEDGEILLVDRKKELKNIKTRLSSSTNIVTVEGNNGVGKTSLINVASFELYREYLVSGTGPFFVPCDFRPDKPEYAHKTEYINPELPQAGEG